MVFLRQNACKPLPGLPIIFAVNRVVFVYNGQFGNATNMPPISNGVGLTTIAMKRGSSQLINRLSQKANNCASYRYTHQSSGNMKIATPHTATSSKVAEIR